jgi:uncharacterized phage protein (TIGR02220 family)
MDAILFLRELQKKGRKYRDIWLNLLIQYDGQDCSIKANVPIGMPTSTYYLIINHGVKIFPLFFENQTIEKNKMTLIIKNKKESCTINKITSSEKQKPVISKVVKKEKIVKPKIIIPEPEIIKEKETIEIIHPVVLFPEVIAPAKKTTTVRKKKDVDVLQIHIDIMEYLNLCAGKRYRNDSKETLSLINTKLSEGFSLDDFKHVILVKTNNWLNTEDEKYLRPETLFGKKFEGYLNQKITHQSQKQKEHYDNVSKATDLGWNN